MFLNYLLSPNTTIISLLITFASTILVLITVKNYNYFRQISLMVAFIPLLWSLWLWCLYDGSGQTYQCVCHIEYLHLSLGIDAVGLPLLILTTAIFPICTALMRTSTGIITFLLLELSMLGSLLVLDLLAFYIFFESSLILFFLLIYRDTDYSFINAAYRLVVYTAIGSMPYLVGTLALYSLCGSTNLLVLVCSSNPLLHSDHQLILGALFFLMFAIKMPLIPLHCWLPEAHVAAPTAGSIILAGITIKLGGLGFIRFVLPIFPVFVIKAFPFIVIMVIISFLFSTLTTFRQIDLKKIVAYSSIAHMALVTLAIFSLSEHSVASSTFMMVAHGLVSPALFLMVGILYERSHTKYLPYLTGLGSHMPIYSSLFFILTLANLSFPLFPNFIAEVLCLLSLFAVHSLYAYIFCISQVLGAVYGFWTFNRIIHGYNSNTFVNTSVADLSRREFAFILPLLIGIFWLGLKPMA